MSDGATCVHELPITSALVDVGAEKPANLNRWSEVGFFGGTFDPPHQGHVQVIQAAQRALGLERTYVVPANQNPLKDSSVTPYEDRLAMTRLQFSGLPGIEVSDLEKCRKPSYTYLSIYDLFMEGLGPANYHVIIGDDSAHQLLRWHKLTELVVFADIYVVGPEAREKRAALPPWIRRHVGIVTVDTPSEHATQVRSALARGERHEMLSDSVYDYIRTKELYK